MKPLKEATKDKHKKAERMPFNMRMFKGKLTKDEYLLYLTQQLAIFKKIEAIGIPSNTLSRVQAITEDIKELIDEGLEAKETIISTQNYIHHLNSLSIKEVQPHVYLNYLAIMFGGQLMKKRIPSSGKMYDFEHQEEAMQSIRAIQKDEWANEVNKAYDFLMHIFEELETITNSKKVIN